MTGSARIVGNPKVWVVETREYVGEGRFDSFVDGIFSSHDKAIAFIKDNPDYGDSLYERSVWWWALYTEVFDDPNHLDDGLQLFKPDGTEIYYQPMDGTWENHPWEDEWEEGMDNDI